MTPHGSSRRGDHEASRYPIDRLSPASSSSSLQCLDVQAGMHPSTGPVGWLRQITLYKRSRAQLRMRRGRAACQSALEIAVTPMAAHNDPIGRALVEAVDGGVGCYQIEHDDGSLVSTEATEFLDTAQNWSPAITNALSRLRGRVLDVGCGAGRHALHLQALGCETIGLDPSPGAVDVCRRRGLDARLGSLGDRALLTEERFDAVLMLGNNLGLLDGPERAQGHLEWLAARCRPGALLVGESMDITRKGPEYLAYFRRVAAAGRPPGQLRLRIVFEGQAGDWFFYWQLTPDELRNVIRNTPWSIEHIDPVAGTDRYVAVMRRQ